MDDAGTEHERGWLRVEDGLVAEVGAGDAARARGEDLRRRGRHARPRQHAPPPLPDAHARPGAGGRPLHLAADALPGLGAASTTRWSTPPRAPGSPSSRSPGCTTVFDHHYVFPRGVSGLVEAELRAAQRARRAHRRLARLDGPRRVRRRPAARLARRGHRRRSSPTPSGSPRSPTAPSCRSPSRRARRSRSRRG